MSGVRPGRRRAKISVTIDPRLLSAVDLYVQTHADTDRSKVMETALRDWYRTRQDEDMTEQFSGADLVDPDERQSWRQLRRTAASRTLKRAAR
jgi:metal-responsive CopG/Arc/MetJ family transcriptional regulator